MSAINPEDFLRVKKPCAECPFSIHRTRVVLRPGRYLEIIADLDSGRAKTFSCHKTLSGAAGPQSQCAGASSMLEKLGNTTVMSRIGVAFGVIDIDHYREAHDLTAEPDEFGLSREVVAEYTQQQRLEESNGRDEE